MTTFPKLLILQTLPIYLASKEEKRINAPFWGGKMLCIAYKSLQQSENNGGINFPNVRDYNLACFI